MLDIVLEVFRAAVLLGLVLYLAVIGKRWSGGAGIGWRLILGGFGLLLFGSLLDITDNFPALNRFVVIGNTEAEALLEKLVGFLGGFTMLAVGLSLWLPRVRRLSDEIARRRDAEAVLTAAHNQLTDEEARFSALVANIPGAIYRIAGDERSRFAYVSDAIAEITGNSAAQCGTAETLDYAALVHAEDRGEREAALERAFTEGESYQLQYRLRHAEGEYRWVAEHGRPVEASDKSQCCVDGAIFDVTEIVEAQQLRRAAAAELENRIAQRTRELRAANQSLQREIADRQRIEAALQRNEARFREIFEECPAAILEEDWRPVKRFLDDLVAQGVEDLERHFAEHPQVLGEAYNAAIRYGISEAAVALYHAEDKEALRRSMFSDEADPDELEGYGRMIVAFYRGAESFEYEAEEIALDGSEITTRVRAVIPPKYRDDWGRALITMEDITDRVAAEEQLRQVQKLKAVGQLTGGIAHDFNNLLAVISGNVEILADRIGANDRSIRALLRATTRASELTSRLLSFSRKQPLSPKSIDVAQLVESLVEFLHRTLGATITTEISMAEDLWAAQADPGQLENALVNLAINARDAMTAGGSLKIHGRNAVLDAAAAQEMQLTPGDYVLLTVADSGEGIAPDLVARVIEPFFTTKDVGEGSGLGLSMAYGFAKQSGGHLRIESAPGKGTEIRLYIPRAGEAPCRPRLDAPPVVAETASDVEPPTAASGETILVLEDNPAVRELAIALLQDLGYGVLAASEGAEALEILDREGQRISLLLSDVVLPGGMTGPEVARRARDSHPELAIIYMSGYSEMGPKQDPAVGFDAPLLNKPFRKRKLAEAIRAGLDSATLPMDHTGKG